MSKARRLTYRLGSLMGNAEAAVKGPVPLGKRLVRKTVYKHVGRGTRSVLGAFGLSR